MNLGERLKKLREKRGWSQVYVSKRLGLKRSSTYANYEYGIRDPDTDTLARLAEIYETTTDYLLYGSRTTDEVKNDRVYNDAETTIRLIEEEAAKMGLTTNDPIFQKLLSDAFDLLRIARGKDKE